MKDNIDEKLNFYCYCACCTILKKIYKNEELDSSDISVISIILEEYRELLYKVKDLDINDNEVNS